jgi:cytochrome c biogenesis protein
VTVTVVDIVGSTGLELKSDPGVPFIYAGYGGLIITSFMSFLSHSQVRMVEYMPSKYNNDNTT